MAAFEDEGYFCVDNLPSEMIRSLVELFMHAGSKVARAAVVSDVRGGSYFEGLAEMLDDLKPSGSRTGSCSSRPTSRRCMTRYKETRRRHPLAPQGSVADGIAREREILRPLRARADVVIDTTGLTAAMLRRKLADELLPASDPRAPGRHLPELRLQERPRARSRPPLRRPLPAQPPLRAATCGRYTGDDREVVDFINRDGDLDRFYERLHPLLDYLLPAYLAEGKAHLVVAIGCTGGRHRSVAIARHLAERYDVDGDYLVEVVHRDIGRPA